jgi:hypothetical protein
MSFQLIPSKSCIDFLKSDSNDIKQNYEIEFVKTQLKYQNNIFSLKNASNQS